MLTLAGRHHILNMMQQLRNATIRRGPVEIRARALLVGDPAIMGFTRREMRGRRQTEWSAPPLRALFFLSHPDDAPLSALAGAAETAR